MKAIRVTSKSSIIHVIGKHFNRNVEFLDRRWWEVKPRMQVIIPYVTEEQMLRIQGTILDEFIFRGYSPSIHVKVVKLED